MPLFEFRCDGCDRPFELLVRGGERISCPACRSERVERLMSAPAARMANALPIAADCPPIEAGPCGRPACCRLPGLG